jgi:hypothetical protein
MAEKLLAAELERLVGTFETANPGQLLALAREKKELLVELFGEEEYVQFERFCIEIVKALLNDRDPPPGVDDNMTWAAMLLHNMKAKLHGVADAYRRSMSE